MASNTTKKSTTTTTSTAKDLLDLTKVAEATLSDVTPEARYALAQSGRSTAMWQAYALAADGKPVKEIAGTLRRSQTTIRNHVWCIHLALAMADVEHRETENGLPPVEVATYLDSAVEAVAKVSKASASEHALSALVEQAKVVRADQRKAIEADSDVKPEERAEALAENTQIAVARRANQRAEALTKQAAEAKRQAAENARKAVENTAQEGEETPAKRAARMAAQERATQVSAAVSVADLSEAIGYVNLAVQKLQHRHDKQPETWDGADLDDMIGLCLTAHTLLALAGPDARAAADERIKAALAAEKAKREARTGQAKATPATARKATPKATPAAPKA